MKLGILSDIHEHLVYLKMALTRLRREEVDQVVVLGDIYETGQRIEETVGLLAEAGAVGVWGNHDIGFCHEPDDWVRRRFDGPVFEHMTALRARHEVAGLLFSHVEPWRDPTDILGSYYLDGPPLTAERAGRTLDAFPHSIVFLGHFHRWLVLNRQGLLAWDATTPFLAAPGDRYLIVIHAVMDGWCATFDTDCRALHAFDLRQP